MRWKKSINKRNQHIFTFLKQCIFNLLMHGNTPELSVFRDMENETHCSDER